MALPPTAAARFQHAGILRAPKGKVLAIPCRFTTGADSGGSPALVYDYDGKISIALTEGTPDLYVITVGSYKRFLAANVTHNLAATVNVSVSGSASAGTVTLSCTANTLASATVDVVIYIQTAES